MWLRSSWGEHSLDAAIRHTSPFADLYTVLEYRHAVETGSARFIERSFDLSLDHVEWRTSGIVAAQLELHGALLIGPRLFDLVARLADLVLDPAPVEIGAAGFDLDDLAVDAVVGVLDRLAVGTDLILHLIEGFDGLAFVDPAPDRIDLTQRAFLSCLRVL